MCPGNQEQRFSQIHCQEGHRAEGLSCRGTRKQDNGTLVLEIIPELGVLDLGRISVTQREIKMEGNDERRKRTPLP